MKRSEFAEGTENRLRDRERLAKLVADLRTENDALKAQLALEKGVDESLIREAFRAGMLWAHTDPDTPAAIEAADHYIHPTHGGRDGQARG